MYYINGISIRDCHIVRCKECVRSGSILTDSESECYLLVLNLDHQNQVKTSNQ